MAAIYFITGPDTGIGKTVLTALLVRHLIAGGVRARAVKPFCSGGRDDARILHRAQGYEVTLAEINPWHFRAPLAPTLAARREGRTVAISEVVDFLHATAAGCDAVLVEGAGGLLSPLGAHFDARDLINRLRAQVIVVAPNRLGAVNQVRLVLAALPETAARQARVALMAADPSNLATRTNLALLLEYVPLPRTILCPRVSWPGVLERARVPVRIAREFQRWGI